jgi:hypothetical protein
MAGLRSTRASAAVERLKKRSGNAGYSMALCAPLELDDFVAFVNSLGPQVEKRVSKHDIAFEKQLVKKKP